MAWKTPNGCWLRPDDEVVWINEDGSYAWEFTGTVRECLPVNDDDDGEIRITWKGSDGPLKTKTMTGVVVPKTWYYPMWVEKIESITALDRMARET